MYAHIQYYLINCPRVCAYISCDHITLLIIKMHSAKKASRAAENSVFSRVFLKMVHDVIFSNSRFMDVFLHPKSMECILLVTYDGYHYI